MKRRVDDSSAAPISPTIGGARMSVSQKLPVRNQRGPDVRAEHVEDAVSEVDDAQDAEDEREPDRDEEEERGERGSVEELLHQDGGRHRRSPRSEATLREVLS